MSHRGKAPVPEPRSICPNCERYFEGDRCPNPKCLHKRGDWDKPTEKKLTQADHARLINDLKRVHDKADNLLR